MTQRATGPLTDQDWIQLKMAASGCGMERWPFLKAAIQKVVAARPHLPEDLVEVLRGYLCAHVDVRFNPETLAHHLMEEGAKADPASLLVTAQYVCLVPTCRHVSRHPVPLADTAVCNECGETLQGDKYLEKCGVSPEAPKYASPGDTPGARKVWSSTGHNIHSGLGGFRYDWTRFNLHWVQTPEPRESGGTLVAWLVPISPPTTEQLDRAAWVNAKHQHIERILGPYTGPCRDCTRCKMADRTAGKSRNMNCVGCGMVLP